MHGQNLQQNRAPTLGLPATCDKPALHLATLALIPLGGSLVIFTPFWRIDTGKYVAGALVRKSRNAGLLVSAASASPNTIFSSAGIHDFASLWESSDPSENEKHTMNNAV